MASASDARAGTLSIRGSMLVSGAVHLSHPSSVPMAISSIVDSVPSAIHHVRYVLDQQDRRAAHCALVATIQQFWRHQVYAFLAQQVTGQSPGYLDVLTAHAMEIASTALKDEQ